MTPSWVLFICVCTGYLGFGASKPSYPQAPPTMEEFEIYNNLSTALTSDSFAMFVIREIFFPSVGQSPVCVPVTFSLTCEGSTQPFNSSFLWTEYNSEVFVGQLLLSSAYYGIVLDGFDWVDYCWFFEDANLTQVLNLSVPFTCNSSDSVLASQLQATAALLKSYASGSVTASSITNYGAYALPWNETKSDSADTVFHRSQVILSGVMAALDVFIFTFSLGICSNVYDALYDNIKCKKNPYYPLFWSAVILSVLWNVGPAWLVLSLDSPHIKYSLVALIPVQLIIALFMKKYPEFPIPGMQWWTLPQEVWSRLIRKSRKEDDPDAPPPPKNFFWEVCRLRSPARAIASFVVQTFAIWSLLVLFTFVVYYSLTVAISLYLYPIQTLVKVLFIKAVAICAVFDVALLFSGQSLSYHCSKKSFVVNITLLSQTLAVLSFLPVLAFLTYTIGGVLFSLPSNQLNGVQGIIALLPSAFLVLVGWYSRGTIFPEVLPKEKGGDVSGHPDINGAESPVPQDGQGSYHGNGHPTTIRMEHDIEKLAGGRSASGGPQFSEHTPLIGAKKA